MRKPNPAGAVLTAFVFILAGVYGLSVQAQNLPKKFAFFAENDLVGGSENCTVQKPATNTSTITEFESLTVYCEVACTIQLEEGFATATDTNGSIVAMTVGTSNNEAFCGSEVAQGTIVAIYNLAAGETQSMNLENFVWPADSSERTLTIRTGNMTGVVRRTIVWGERP